MIEAEIEIEVPFFDVDPMQVVWHGHYVKYLEQARCALLEKIGYGYEAMSESGYAWPVIDLQLRYIGAARFGQRLKVRAALSEWENRLKIDYTVRDAASGQRLTKASSVQVALDLSSYEMQYVSPPALTDKVARYHDTP